MTFNVTQFKAIVAANGGDDRVLSLMFNNAWTRTFSVEEPFVMADHLDEPNEMFTMIEKDVTGLPYLVVKPVEYLEGIAFATTDEDIEKLDRRYIRG